MRRLWLRLLDWFWQRKSRLLDLAGYGLVLAGVAMWSRAAAMVLAGVVVLALAFAVRRAEQTPESTEPTKP